MHMNNGLFGNIDSSHLLLMNTMYHRPTKYNNYTDKMDLIFKDTLTDEKVLVSIPEPKMKMYVVKEELRDYDYYPFYKKLSECDVKLIKIKNLINEICEIGGDRYKQYKSSCIKKGMYRSIKNVHKCPYVLGTDYDPEDYYRIEWLLNYHKPGIKMDITRQYLDIEVDSIKIAGVPENGDCPVNACSITDPTSKTVFVFLLRNKENPQIEEFENNLDDFRKKCHEAFDESFGEFDYQFFMYDEEDEIKLIKDIFRLINTLKRDFLLIWNLPFDIPYLMDRIKILGYDPMDIIPHKDFDEPILTFIKDNKHFDIKQKKNIFNVSSYTVYIDQMDLYAKIRKSESELKSLKLNSIAQKELGDSKIDYSDEANIKTLPYKNYPLFVLYNIKDTLIQYGIDIKTSDLDDLFETAYENCTKYSSVFSQTVFLKNRAYYDFYHQGFIIGNNRNVSYDYRPNDEDEDDGETLYEGALVGNPLLNGPNGMKLFGKRSKYIFNDVIDFDFSSMYPNIIISNNIGMTSLIGKVVIDGFAHLNQDVENKKFDQGRDFIEDYLTCDRTKLCNKYFNLPTCEELINELKERDSK